MKSRVYELNKCAAEFYHENLYRPTARPAQEYVKKRRLDNKTLKAFKIGYSGRFNELYTELKSKGFTEEEIDMIKAAILHHRNRTYESEVPGEHDTLSELLYWADKKSRNCFACEMKKECNWDEEKMNLKIGN